MPRINLKNHPVVVGSLIDGKYKSIEYKNWREALMFTSMRLVDNGYMSKREAQEWAGSIKEFSIYGFKPGMPDLRFEFTPRSRFEEDAKLGYLAAQMNLRNDK